MLQLEEHKFTFLLFIHSLNLPLREKSMQIFVQNAKEMNTVAAWPNLGVLKSYNIHFKSYIVFYRSNISPIS